MSLRCSNTAKARGFDPETAALDMGYDNGRVYGECEERDVRPIIPLRETQAVKLGAHKPPTCEHGEWRFAGADARRGASKWRCPSGECRPASRWLAADRLHPLVPRQTSRWRKLYRAAPLSSVSSAVSSTSGRCRPYGFGGSSGSRSTPT
jgi:hypothetical protein